MWPPETPRLTVDAIIQVGESIVLVKRRNPPYGWALPGGFVEIGETVESAVCREAQEETGLLISDLWLVGVFSDPVRDSRFHTVSVVFGAIATGNPQGADDAERAELFSPANLPEQIAFDHRLIIERYIRLRKSALPDFYRSR